MKDEGKAREQLIGELTELRRRVSELELQQTKQARALEELRASEEKYRSLVEKANDGVAIIQHGRVKYANERLAALWGGRVEEVLETHFTKYIHPADADFLADQYRRRIAGEDVPAMYETRLVCKDGREVFVELNAGIITHQGAPADLVIVRDITDRKQTDARLERNLNFTRALLDSVPTPVFFKDKDGRYLGCNRAFTEIMGKTAAEILGKTVFELWPGRQAEMYHRKDLELMANPQRQAYEFEITDKDGKVRPVIYIKDAFYDENGKLAGIVGAFLDITERKQIERALSLSEETFRSIVKSSPMGIHIYRLEEDNRLVFIGANPAADRLLGVDHSQFIGKTVEEAFPLLAETEIPERYRKAARDGENWFSEQVNYEYGNIVGAFEVHAFQMTPGKVAILFNEVTERKRAVEALRQSEERIQNIIRHSSSMFYSHTPDHVLTYVSPQCEHILGCKPEEAMVRWQEFLSDHPINQLGIEVTERAIQTGERQPPYELELITRDGRKIWGLVDESPIVQDGKTVAIVGSVTDISARKQTEESERKQRQLSDTLRAALEAGASLSSSLEFEVVLDRLLENLEKVVPFDGGSILLVMPESGRVRLARLRGYEKIGRKKRESLKELTLEIASTENLNWMYEHKEPLIIPDTTKKTGWIPVEATSRFRSWIGAPILVKGEVVAFFSLQHITANFFTPEHLSLIQAFAGQAALAMQNARLFDEVQRRVEETSALLSASMSLSNLDSEAILRIIGEHARSIFMADGCRIFLLEPDGETLRCELALQENEVAFFGLTIRIGQGVTGAVAASGEAEIVNDMTLDPRAMLVPGTEEEPEAIMFAPLKQRQQTIGVISIRRVGKQNPFKPSDLELLKAFASLAASAVSNARLFDETRRRAERLSALHVISQRLGNLLDLQTIGEVILPEIENLLGWKHGSIWLVEGEAGIRMLNHSTPGLEGLEREKELERLRSLITGFGVGIIGSVIKDGQAIRSGNVHADRRYIEGRPNILSELCVPLKAAQKTIGCINFESENENAFSEEDEQVLTTLSGEIAVAVERARLFEEARRRAEEFSILYRITSDLGATTSLDALMLNIAERITNLLDVPGGVVYLYDKQNQELEIMAATSSYVKIGSRLKMQEGMAGKVAQSRRPLVIDDYRIWTERSPQFEGLPFTSVAQVPMLYGGDLLGVIGAFNLADDKTGKSRRFTENDVQLLSLFATAAGGAVHGIRLLENARRRLSELETFQAVSAALRQARTIQEMLPIFVKYSAQAIGAQSGSIYLLEESTGEWVAQGWITAQGNWGPSTGDLRHRKHEGVTGRVGANGEMYVTADWRTDSVTVPLPGELAYLNDLKSGISLPLRAEETIIGVMHLWFRESHTFTDAEKSLLTAIADMAGNAVQRARLYEETQKRLRYLSALHNIDTAINASVDLRITLKIILGNTAKELGVDAVAIALLYPQSRTLEYVASHGFRSRMVEGTRLHPGEGLAWQAVIQRQMVSLVGAGQKNLDLFKEEGFVSQFAIPLIAKGQVQGILQVFHRSAIRPSPDWINFLATLAGQAAVAVDNSTLYESLQRSNLELTLAYDATIEGWSRALDLRDRETEGHTQRVTELTLNLARAMGLGEEQIMHIRRGALLHDIGKMGVPDNILFKQGDLTEEEWETMRQHPRFAYEMLSPIEYLRPALDIPYCHHEKWDGSGYPRGLKGQDIPLAARLFAVVDVYDAVTADRPYRKAWSHEQAIEYLRQEAGKQFDPQAVQTFLKIIPSLLPNFNATNG
jgi:PAS domain S-box-containing protein